MVWEIRLETDSVEYSYDGSIYKTELIKFIGRTTDSEPNCGYQEPDNQIMIDLYRANSEHGIFEWSVSARQEGFKTLVEIDDIEVIKIPLNCVILTPPKFYIFDQFEF